MKNREEAEAKALELFPDSHYRNAIVVRQAFLKCYDLMTEQNQSKKNDKE